MNNQKWLSIFNSSRVELNSLLKHGLVYLGAALFLSAALLSCQAPTGSTSQTNSSSPAGSTSSQEDADWASSKATQSPICALPNEYQNPEALSIGTLAWEDGLYVSRDGLNLYCSYIPADAFSMTLAGALPTQFYLYVRGPSIGQDFTDPPGFSDLGHPWLHADIAIAQRSSTSQGFGDWQLSNIKGQYYNLGAAQGIQNATNPAVYDYFFYTNDNPSCTKIFMSKSVWMNPSLGSAITISGDQASYRQDNPDCENVGGTLVLFFESDDTRPNGKGAQDIWYTTSSDSGATWSIAANVSSVNTSGYDGQPHLYNDGTSWWLYCTQTNTDGKLAIFRYQKGSDWNSWTGKTLVVSAGSSQGVGEPSLTTSGDLYFVTVFKKTVNGTTYDMYDCDPWMMKKK